MLKKQKQNLNNKNFNILAFNINIIKLIKNYKLKKQK